MSTSARVYVGTVVVLCVVIFGLFAFPFSPATYVLALPLLTIASFFTQVYELEVSPRWFLSTHATIATTALYVGDLPLALWVILISTVGAETVLRWGNVKQSFWRFLTPVVFNISQLIVCVSFAGLTYRLVTLIVPTTGQPYLAMVVSFLAYLLANTTLVATIIALTSEAHFIRLVRSWIKTYHLQLLTMGSLAITTTTLYEVSPTFLLLALVPLALVHYSSYNYLSLSRHSHQAFKKITDLLSERDEYTAEHSEDVERLSVLLAEAMRLSDATVDVVRAGAAIHDIGKLAIPDAILNKAGGLTADEFKTMQKHTIIGAEIIKHLDIYRDVVPIVRHEHEHWDGSGYPDGISGEAIPVGARIVAVVDVYSALTTERVYRPALGKPLAYSHDDACTILHDMAGSVLDPALVEVFVRDVAPILERARDEGTIEKGR